MEGETMTLQAQKQSQVEVLPIIGMTCANCAATVERQVGLNVQKL